VAYELIWSLASRDDLKNLILYIAEDDSGTARAFASRLIAKVDVLQTFPEIGKIVPEKRDTLIREPFPPYRLIYRLDHEQRTVTIARVWHSARSFLDLSES
jgi:plasmid stabilization system protein ParE